MKNKHVTAIHDSLDGLKHISLELHSLANSLDRLYHGNLADELRGHSENIEFFKRLISQAIRENNSEELEKARKNATETLKLVLDKTINTN